MTTSDRLIESTQDLLWERGYVGTSPRAIQERAGAGQGSMYHHFAGKADLARAALERSAAELQAQAEAQLSGPGSPIERLRAYLTRERDVLRGCRIGRMAQDPDIVASPELRQPVDDTLAWVRRRLAEVLAEAEAAGELAPGLDATATAATLLAVLQGGYVIARAAGSVEPYEAAIRGALALLAARTNGRPSRS